MPGKKIITNLDIDKLKEDLYKLYIEQDMRQLDIANIYKVSSTTIGKWLSKFNIPIKNKLPIPSHGDRFNNLIFLKIDPNKNRYIHWICKCDCGKIKSIRANNVYYLRTKTCNCLNKKVISSIKWDGYEEISGAYWHTIIRNARKRNLEINITKKYIWDIFIQQDKRCKFTKVKLVFTRRNNAQQTASLDRINSKEGYIEGNVQWVTKEINMAKQKMTDEKFIEMCRLVAENNPRSAE